MSKSLTGLISLDAMMLAPASSFPARTIPIIFALGTFSGAALLFLLEPMVGKSMLPWYGGTPAVWNTCVFFFQFVLLGGYLYAHLLQRHLKLSRQLMIHAVVSAAALATLPIRFDVTGLVGASRRPEWSLLADLVFTIGPVFFVVSTTTPLLQAWYALGSWRTQAVRLYVASNAGSLLGLIVYPTALEGAWSLSIQRAVFSFAFAGVVILVGICGALTCWLQFGVSAAQLAPTRTPDTPISAEQRLKWFLWSLCPSSLMLGVTTYLSTEIAPMPAIWMLPLSLYLASFIIAFADPPNWSLVVSRLMFVILAVAAAAKAASDWPGSEWYGLAVHNGLLFSGALALHGQLAAARPAPRRLTEFYLWISFGGLCGSIVNSLIAPLAFNWLAEYPLAIGLGLALIAFPRPQKGFGQLIVRAILIAGIWLGMSWNVYFSESSRLIVLRARTFFGEFHVTRGKLGVMQQLVHGRTVHGMQIASKNARERRPPLTYYFFTGPIGQTMLAYRGTPVGKSVAVVGLGIGSLASYAESGENYTFYEIDPEIARVAEDDRYFTFLDDARQRGARLKIVLGDARLRLREADDGSFGLLVLDAFTSDAIPVHLLTKDAIVEYRSKLHEHGVLAFHISNLYVDLEPVLGNIAADLGMTAYMQIDDAQNSEELRRGKSPSRWLVMAGSDEDLEPLLPSGRWNPCRTDPATGVWTDDRSQLWRAFKWVH